MASVQNSYEPQYFTVVHPLHDAPEQKCSSEGLGHIAMTLMLGYHVLDLAGVVHAIR